MFDSIRLLDRILRGEVTRPSQLVDGKLTFPIYGLSFVGVVLAMIYGSCMGLYSIMRALELLEAPRDYRQLVASTVKTPALFVLTLLVTFPSLYVFNALVGSRLQVGSMLRLLLAALGVNIAVLASFGPIVAFFSLSTNSYGFMVLLNVAMFAVAGTLGLMFLIQTLNRLQHAQKPLDCPVPEQPSADQRSAGQTEVDVLEAVDESMLVGTSAEPTNPLHIRHPAPSFRSGPIDPVEGQSFRANVRLVFGIWIFVFGIVGAQMGWILRPFIGSPDTEFTWLRPRDSQANFFNAVSRTFFDTVFGGAPKDRRNEPRGAFERTNESTIETRR